jgi:segregation and condensation protein A
MTVSMPPGDPGLPLDSASMAFGAPYAVKLSIFEGPLDLLLHLIRQNEVEITDIPVAAISEQYLTYLDVMHELNLDVVGDYLVMAATLAWIKSRMLLPPETSGEDGEEIDPRAELIARLLEYQRFKEASEKLGDRQLLGRDVYTAFAPHAGEVPEGEREIEVGLFELVKAFKTALETAKSTPKVHEVEAEQITVHERMIAVMESLEQLDAIEFQQIFERADGHPPSRAVLVTTFLAILELTRLAVLRIFQSLNENSVPKGPIHLRRTEQPEQGDWRELISDVM